jgi:hypothetical protein
MVDILLLKKGSARWVIWDGFSKNIIFEIFCISGNSDNNWQFP